MDTIVALATARGRAGVAVIRVSGGLAWQVCEKLTGTVPPVRQARLLTLRNDLGEKIDSGLVICFEDGQSFTGERVCEFQIHGSVAVVSAVLKACVTVEGVRMADAGEFTKRAFLEGRMDLTEVEALADLIDAETEAQRRQAQAVLDGSAGKIIASWRDDLLLALSMLEAAMDFSDEELPDEMTDLVVEPLNRVLMDLESQLVGRKASEAVRDGFEVALIGQVNAGKSSLLNALAGRDAAITSERAGTTRDVVEVRMDIAGYAVTLIDTAGLRATDDEIESEGISRGQKRAVEADLRVYLKSTPEEIPEFVSNSDIILLSKSDLWGVEGVSAKTGEGISGLLSLIECRLNDVVKSSSAFVRERHFDSLERARASLDIANTGLCDGGLGWEVASEEIRAGIRSLDGIVGRIDVEDVLGRIFSSFCIGK